MPGVVPRALWGTPAAVAASRTTATNTEPGGQQLRPRIHHAIKSVSHSRITLLPSGGCSLWGTAAATVAATAVVVLLQLQFQRSLRNQRRGQTTIISFIAIRQASGSPIEHRLPSTAAPSHRRLLYPGLSCTPPCLQTSSVIHV